MTKPGVPLHTAPLLERDNLRANHRNEPRRLEACSGVIVGVCYIRDPRGCGKRGENMNRFEQAVYDCMKPTAKLLARTTKPLHRTILLNFWRHVHLEGAGEYDKILAPDMMVDHPVYRVTWGANPGVIEGKEGVRGFYNSVGETVLWHSDDRLAVEDWGISDEITFHQLAAGSDLRLIGYKVDHADRLYHVPVSYTHLTLPTTERV